MSYGGSDSDWARVLIGAAIVIGGIGWGFIELLRWLF